MIEGRREHLGGGACPSALFNFSQLPPLAMRVRSQWVCWKYELDGKWRKPPFSPLTGQKTDVTRPGRWATYEQALSIYQREGYDGLGYVFLPQEGYTRLDFDHCRNLETGQLDRWAIEVLLYLQKPYAELSPSGCGIHAVARGRLPGIDRKQDGLGEHGQGALEMYSQGQGYLTWTNERIDDYGDGIAECDELASLYEIVFWEQIFRARHRPGRCPTDLPVIISQTEPRGHAQEKADTWLLTRARRAKNGQVFSQLYDELPGPGSQHEDDFRLCLLLLYWTQDRQGVPDLSWADRLFRYSQRFIGGRWEKWDRKLGAYTYGQVTLYQAYMKRYLQF